MLKEFARRLLASDPGNRQWNIPKLREEILPKNNFFNGFEITHEFESIGCRIIQDITARGVLARRPSRTAIASCSSSNSTRRFWLCQRPVKQNKLAQP